MTRVAISASSPSASVDSVRDETIRSVDGS
jgi:hypothetical protein